MNIPRTISLAFGSNAKLIKFCVVLNQKQNVVTNQNLTREYEHVLSFKNSLCAIYLQV